MSKRSDKMYKDSPTVGDDGEGKKVVKKSSPEKESAKSDSGTDDMAGTEEHMKMYHKHAKERLDTHHKHEEEHHKMFMEHMKSAVEGKAGGPVTEHKEKHEGGHEDKKEKTDVEKKTD